MILGLAEGDVRAAELRVREALAAAEGERRRGRSTRPLGVGRTVVSVRDRLGATLVGLGPRLRGSCAVADARALPGEQGAGA